MTVAGMQDGGRHSSWPRRRIERLLSRAGVRLNGERPWDVQVHEARLYRRVLLHGSLGLGEAYVEGWWDCEALDELFRRLLTAGLWDETGGLAGLLELLRCRLQNLQRPSRAFQIGERHYDVGNRLFRAMLGPSMVYTEGLWDEGVDDLDAAQHAKLERVCRALRLEPGMRLLDIGCGWGTLLRHAARQHGIEGVGVTVSREQADFARQACDGLPVTIRLVDYRELDGAFDRVVSLGMFEHVGHRNWESYMQLVRGCLADDGLFHISTVGKDVASYASDPWIVRYIFPNSELPSPAGLSRAFEGRFMLESWRNRGPDYDRTLMAWHANLEGAWQELGPDYDERFRRMWRYYLLSCAGAFRARAIQLWELVLSPEGLAGSPQAHRIRGPRRAEIVG